MGFLLPWVLPPLRTGVSLYAESVGIVEAARTAIHPTILFRHNPATNDHRVESGVLPPSVYIVEGMSDRYIQQDLVFTQSL
jgi:hypothetical protein|tara:strand:- start:223 stop:465 length:243 start_codon:yes stop_codon:yes gene_type:complete